jgi:hypothetical protein
MKLGDEEKRKIEKDLAKRVKEEIGTSEDPIERNVERKQVTNIMMKIEVQLRPVVRDEKGIDLTKIKFNA